MTRPRRPEPGDPSPADLAAQWAQFTAAHPDPESERRTGLRGTGSLTAGGTGPVSPVPPAVPPPADGPRAADPGS